MQPYFLPYIAYWQLIASVDEFVVYDNIEFTKKGWFNRNRILDSDHDRLFTIPIKKDSDYLPVNQRFLADDSSKEISRILRIVEVTYKRAPYFQEVYALIKQCFMCPDKNLFAYNYNAIQAICTYLSIETRIVISSAVSINHDLKAEQKVLAICKAQEASTYINAIGGQQLYDRALFAQNGLELAFIKSHDIQYRQFDDEFVPWLSIIDVLMFNDVSTVKKILKEYELV
ncbi:MAG: WbqC family protein [Cytophaga sp.]|nr:WbqC family protein [Undibacterium sp.]